MCLVVKLLVVSVDILKWLLDVRVVEGNFVCFSICYVVEVVYELQCISLDVIDDGLGGWKWGIGRMYWCRIVGVELKV